MNEPAIDLTRYAFKRELRGYNLYGTWFFTGDDPEPCLVLVPSSRLSRGNYMPAVICLSDAYKYDDPDYLLSAAIIFTKSFNQEDSLGRINRIAEIIHGHLQDLIEMPPYSGSGKKVVADAVLTDKNSGKEYEAELKS